MKNIPSLTLSNGVKIPQFGYGVYLVPEEECEKCCLEAIKLGYRHIDTAHAYNNEKEVGLAVKKCGLPRKELFITSKLWPTEYGEGKTLEAIKKMLKRLDMEYLDLILLHQAGGDYCGAYKDMEKALEMGLVKSIGLSNFESDDLDEILKISKVKPHVEQLECHPYYQQTKLKKKLEPYKTIIESWYPIGHGDKELLNEPIFVKMGKKYNKTTAQIILRWHIQAGYVVFPKSTNPVHIKENLDIFDFNLSNEEMEEIHKLDNKKRYVSLTKEYINNVVNIYKPKYD